MDQLLSTALQVRRHPVEIIEDLLLDRRLGLGDLLEAHRSESSKRSEEGPRRPLLGAVHSVRRTSRPSETPRGRLLR
jgi:hypothetical protein